VPTEAIPPDTDEASALFRSRLADTRTLVILDNARGSGQVKPLLPATAGCAVVVTSRLRLAQLAALHDTLQITVGSLDTPESLQLLRHLVGAERIEAEPEAARRLALQCAGLPLALRIIGTNLAARPGATLEDTAAELSHRDRLSRLAVEGDPTTTVAAAFDLSYQTLQPDEELLYLSLALLPGADFSEELAAALTTGEPEAAGRILDRLAAAHRVEEYRPGRYRFHDLVREYARRKAEDVFDSESLQRLRERAVDWYAGGTSLLPTDEYRNIVAAFLEWNGRPTVSRLLTRLIPFADAGYREEPGAGDEPGYRDEPADAVYDLPELAAVAEQGIASGRHSEDPMDAVRAYALADAVAYASGDLPRSMEYAQKTLEWLRRTPHGDRTGKARNDLGTTLTQLGRYREAVSLLREAVAAADRSGLPHVQVETLTSLGSVLRRMGIFAEAEALFLRARDIDAAAESGPTTVYPLLSLAELYTDTGRVAEAGELCRSITEMLRDHPSKYFRARLHFRRAAVHVAEGDHARAEADLLRGIALAEATNSWRHQLIYTYRLAELLVETGRPDRAGEALERVGGLGRYQTSESLALRARVLCRLHTRTGDLGRAVSLGRQSCDVFAAMPDPLRHAESLLALAAAHAERGEAAEAAALRAEARERFGALGVDRGRGETKPVD
jgi:tetratricopeptide (TPR) repeat protein